MQAGHLSVMLGMMLIFMVLTVDGQDDMWSDLDMESMAGGDAGLLKLIVGKKSKA